MKKRLLPVLILISTLSACTHNARLYPIQGPLSTQTPPPVIFAKITGTDLPQEISIVLSDGEVCKGHWVMVKAREGAASTSASTIDMSSAWDAVYGSGFYVADVLGARHYARAVASGDRGTVVNVELYRPDERGHDDTTLTTRAKGVARDSKGNVYKLVL